MNNILNFESNSFEQKLTILENLTPQTFQELHEDMYSLTNLRYIYNFLYHGIRFQNHLEKLESILKEQAILAGNYQKNYYSYSDNCNEGEYISLLSIDKDYDLEYETFILPNITLIISSECQAIKTIYLPFNEWEQIKGKKTKNRYSYAHNEYQVKKIIPISMVKAIGIPARYLRTINKEEQLNIYLHDILELMTKYQITLPIVDTSAYNIPIVTIENHITKKKILNNNP